MKGAEISTVCDRCEHEFYTPLESWWVICPKCNFEKIRPGGEDFCKCSHKHMDHAGNQGNFDKGCSKCNCLGFYSITEQKQDDFDREQKADEGCSHLFKRNRNGKYGENTWQCVECGCVCNMRPTFGQSVDEDM